MTPAEHLPLQGGECRRQLPELGPIVPLCRSPWGKGLFGVAGGLKGSAMEVAGQGSQSLLTNPSPWRREVDDVTELYLCAQVPRVCDTWELP